MVRASKKRPAGRIPAVLADVLGVAVDRLRVTPGGLRQQIDLLVDAGGHRFAIDVVASSDAGRISAKTKHLAGAAKKVGPRVIPTIVATFMGASGRKVAADAGVSWFDLSGNARIVAPGLRVVIDGRPNRLRTVGRPSSVFAPKSARVARWLLMHPTEGFSQREIARNTSMTDGFVSRIVSRLLADGYVDRLGPAGGDRLGRATARVQVRDPSLLLDAWADEYDFEKHTIIKGHIAARSGDAATRFIADVLRKNRAPHAATGLSAAWQLTRFAGFRIASLFLESEPTPQILEALGFREDERGANVWLVVPNDTGVFHGAADVDGVRCVHPVQAYLDLKAHPERAAEAAEHLRAERLKWGSRG